MSFCCHSSLYFPLFMSHLLLLFSLSFFHENAHIDRTGLFWSSGVEGSVACCGEVESTTGVGSSRVASRDFSEVVATSWVTTTLFFLIKGSGVEDSDDSSSGWWGTWAVGSSSSLWRGGWVLGQATHSLNCSTIGMESGGATSWRLCSKIIFPWCMLRSMASKRWKSAGGRVEGTAVIRAEGGAADVEAGWGATIVEGASTGLALGVLAP